MSSRPAEPARVPRVVVVTRKTQLRQLIEARGTPDQARFYLRSRRAAPEPYERADQLQDAAFRRVVAAIPNDWRRALVERAQLDRFLFAPDDVVVVIGQDGLVANVAKYLRGQPVVGFNPDPSLYDGVLCRHSPKRAPNLLWALAAPDLPRDLRFERRVMAEALREDGQRLLALNEVFIGQRGHQSARYRLQVGGREERQSSSGVLCSTGTGSTGWARSIAGQRALPTPLPSPEEPQLAWMVREPFPSVATGTTLSFGLLAAAESITLSSEMGEGGVIFADGIETDALEFLAGHTVEVRCAQETLNLLVPA